MNRVIISLLISSICCFSVGYAQDLSQLRIIGSPELVQDGLVSSDIRDSNGRICAGIMIVSDMEGFTYQSNNGVVDVNRSPGKDIVYVSSDERLLEVFHTGYEPLKLILSEYGIDLESKRIWEFKITGDKKLTEIPISIITQPDDVEKIIDGKQLGTGESYQLSAGKHSIKLQKDGYKSIIEEIAVSETSSLFKFTLQEIKQQLLTIKSIPNEAQINIDDIGVGRTNKQIFRYPGHYNLKLTKNKYETIDEDIAVTEGGDNTFTYTLIKTTAILTIITGPSDAEIYLNSEKKTSKTLDISPGRHKIDVKRRGYFPETRTITVLKGKDLTETFTLIQKTGDLQVVVEPMETKVVLKRGIEQIDSWTGAKIIKDLQIGDYTLSCSATGFKSQLKTIAVNLNQVTDIEIVMEEGSDIPESMVFVEGGTFTMGSNDGDSDEKPAHQVTVSSFYISKYEVTQREWLEIMGNNPSNFKGDDLPVENISWYEALEFCNKKSLIEGLVPCYDVMGKMFSGSFPSGYRLPTEAEWEYAACGGNKSGGYKYSGSDTIKDVAWYSHNSNDQTHRIGGKNPNKLGLYDMSGNVWEWCWDMYGKYSSSSVVDPKSSSSAGYHILRGGAWDYGDWFCRTTSRHRLKSNQSRSSVGVRVVLYSLPIKSP